MCGKFAAYAAAHRRPDSPPPPSFTPEYYFLLPPFDDVSVFQKWTGSLRPDAPRKATVYWIGLKDGGLSKDKHAVTEGYVHRVDTKEEEEGLGRFFGERFVVGKCVVEIGEYGEAEGARVFVLKGEEDAAGAGDDGAAAIGELES